MQTKNHPMWLPFEKFKEIYGRVPRLSVDMVIRTDDGIVMTKRSHEPAVGQWHIPGGTVLFGERVEDAIHRLAKDETGVKVEIVRELGHIVYEKIHAAGYFGWPIAIVFEAKLKSGKLRGSKWQGKEIATFKELPEGMLADQADFLREKFAF